MTVADEEHVCLEADFTRGMTSEWVARCGARVVVYVDYEGNLHPDVEWLDLDHPGNAAAGCAACAADFRASIPRLRNLMR